jgi:6-phosphogluconolactonase (cycloisomerase 2 family)
LALVVALATVLGVAAPFGDPHLCFVDVLESSSLACDCMNQPRFSAISPDGKHLYATAYQDDSLLVFERSAGSGTLSFVEVQENFVGPVQGLNGAHHVVVSPEGKHVYVSGADVSKIAVFERNASTGALTWIEAKTGSGIWGIRGMAMSPDGEHLYATGSGDDAVAVFSRDGATGELTWVEMIKDGVDCPACLDGARFVAVSPDGAHVYVVGELEDAVAVFSRDGSTGELTFVEIVRTGAGLKDPTSVAVSPDGNHVYTTGEADHSVGAYSRDAGTGELTFIEGYVAANSGGTVPGLYKPYHVGVSPDGAFVFATGYNGHSVVLFERLAAGKLNYLNSVTDGVGVADGLYGAFSTTIDPEGKHLYAAGSWDSALSLLQLSLLDLFKGDPPDIDR